MLQKQADKVHFHYQTANALFRNRGECKSFLQQLFRSEKRAIKQLTYVFCSDEYLLQINRQHLKHNNYTDIISFCLSAPGKPIVGEIYISIERVKDNARKFSEPFTRELHRVIFHGALHLCGYADKSAEEAKRMRLMEEKYLAQYGL
jgi:probable rRNA maturation factor